MSAPQTVVFVDLDTQLDLLAPEGKLPIPGAGGIIGNLHWLTDFASRNGIPIISGMLAFPDEAAFPENVPPHCLARSSGAAKLPETLTDNVLVIGSEERNQTISCDYQLILEHQGFDLFHNVNAELVFAAFPVKRCVIFGVPTELTVKAAVVRLGALGYDIQVVRDAILPLNAEDEDAALTEMAVNGAKFVETKALIEKLASRTPGEER
jgi:nicotinamidase-related amidase